MARALVPIRAAMGSLVYLQREHLPQRVRVFIDFMAERFRKHFRGE